MSDTMTIPASALPAVQDKRPPDRAESGKGEPAREEFATVLEALAIQPVAESAAIADPAAASIVPVLPVGLPPSAAAPVAQETLARDVSAAPSGTVGDRLRGIPKANGPTTPAPGGAPSSATAASASTGTGTRGDNALAAADGGEPADFGRTLEQAKGPHAAAANDGEAPIADPPQAPSTSRAPSDPGPNDGGVALRERSAPLPVDAKLPIQHPQFGERLSQQIVVLAQHGIQHAHLSLNPPELGPVDVRITLQYDEATVHLAAASGTAREALQDALPRLREMFDQAGVRLNDAGVYTDLPGQQAFERAMAQDTGGRRAADEAATREPTMTGHGAATGRALIGLIDAYI